jgi:hypothetical protein
LKIFSPNKLAILTQNAAHLYKKVDRNFGFQEKRQPFT